MKGKIVFLEQRNGKKGPYARVGVLPEGSDKPVFFTVLGTVNKKTGDTVECDPEKGQIFNGKEAAPKEAAPLREARPYINRSVALQAAIQLLAAELAAGLVPLEGDRAEQAVNLARRFLTFLENG